VPTVWRWQQRYLDVGLASLKRHKTRPSRVPPLPMETTLKRQADPARIWRGGVWRRQRSDHLAARSGLQDHTGAWPWKRFGIVFAADDFAYEKPARCSRPDPHGPRAGPVHCQPFAPAGPGLCDISTILLMRCRVTGSCACSMRSATGSAFSRSSSLYPG